MYQGYGFDKYINRKDLDNTIKYVVRKGDSLYKIAEAYNTTVSKIVTINNLTSTMIYPNQVLFIPVSNTTNSNILTIKDYLLSKNVNISNFDTDILAIKIEARNDDKKYEILKTDTLDLILSKTNLTPYQLIELNKKEWLEPGDKIIVK